MNPAQYAVDPKFPPTEEYTQSSYIPSPGTDYYSGQHYGGYTTSIAGQHGVTTAYGRDSVSSTTTAGYGGYASAAAPTTGYYHHHHPPPQPPPQTATACGMPHHPPPPQIPMPGHVAPSVLTSHATEEASPVTHQSQQSPDSSPQHTPVSVSLGNGPQHHHSHHQQHNLHQSHQHVQQQAPSQQDIQQEGSPSDCSEGADSQGPRVIYPWMKKIHVAGAGKEYTFTLERSNSVYHKKRTNQEIGLQSIVQCNIQTF